MQHHGGFTAAPHQHDLRASLAHCLEVLHNTEFGHKEELFQGLCHASSSLDLFSSPPPQSQKEPPSDLVCPPAEGSHILMRLERIQRHLLQLEPERTSAAEEGQGEEREGTSTMRLIWREFDSVTKLTFGLLVPVLSYYGWCTIKGQQPSELLTFALDTYSQSVGIYAVQIMHSQFRKHLGVTRTLTHIFQLLSFMGSVITTMAYLGKTNTLMGKAMFLLNLMHTLGYGYMVLLTLTYNLYLPDPRDDSRRVRGVVHWKGLTGYSIAMSLLLYVWIKDAGTAIDLSNSYGILALLGFMLSSIGVLRGGWKSATTSIPVIRPFSAVAPLAASQFLTGVLTKLPFFTSSPVTRIYTVGYSAICYCLCLILLLNFKEDRKLRSSSSEALNRQFVF